MKRQFLGVIGGLAGSMWAAGLGAQGLPATRDDVVAHARQPGSPVECMDSQRAPLRVALTIASPRAEPFTDIIRDEVTAIWRRHGVPLHWVDGASPSSLDGVLRLMVQDGELLSAKKRRYAFAWIHFAGGRPRNMVWASRRTALAYVAREVARLPEALPMERLLDVPRFREVLARLLAWSLAHEIGHYVLGPRHSGTGLMRRAFVPSDLIHGREASVSLTPVEIHRLAASTALCRQDRQIAK